MRTRLLMSVIGTLAALTVALGAGAFRSYDSLPDQQEASASASRPATTLARIDACVTDHEGRPVLDLGLEDFEVRADGVLQEIDSVEAGMAGRARSASEAGRSRIESAVDEQREARRPGARLVALFLDEYHVSPGADTARVRDGVARFIDDQLRPDDLVVVMKPLDPLASIRLTRDRAAIGEAVRSFTGRKGDYAPRTPFEQEYLSRVPAALEAGRAQIVLSALHALAAHTGGLREGRKALVFVSGGFGNDAPRGGGQLPDVRAIVRTANRFNVAIYAIDPGTDGGVPAARDQRDPQVAVEPGRAVAMLQTLAGETSGEAIVHADALDPGFRRIARDLDASYLLTYRPSHGNDGKFHTVQIRVKRSDVQVRARPGYWASGADDAGGARPAPLARSQPSTGPIRTRPLRQSALIRPWFGMARGIDGRTRVSFTWEAGRTPVDGRQRTRAEVVVLSATAADGTPLFHGRIAAVQAGGAGAGGLPARAVFEALPGRVEIDMTIQAADHGVLDSDAREVQVPDLGGTRTVIGTPEVLRMRTAREFLALAADPDAPPVVSREFSRTERLLIRVPAYGPAGTVPVVTARLLNRPGRPIREVAAMPAPSRDGATQFDLQLAGLPFGEYTLELTAASAAGKAAAVIVFRVTS